jgi:hypothetical protein
MIAGSLAGTHFVNEYKDSMRVLKSLYNNAGWAPALLYKKEI